MRRTVISVIIKSQRRFSLHQLSAGGVGDGGSIRSQHDTTALMVRVQSVRSETHDRRDCHACHVHSSALGVICTEVQS